MGAEMEKDCLTTSDNRDECAAACTCPDFKGPVDTRHVCPVHGPLYADDAPVSPRQEEVRADLDRAFAVLDEAERFVAKIEGPEDYALAPAIATARGEFRCALERLSAVDAILAEIEMSGYGMGRGPSHTPIRDLARQARTLLKEAS